MVRPSRSKGVRWTKEDIAKAVNLYSSDRSMTMAELASHFPGRTRASLIGIMHREARRQKKKSIRPMQVVGRETIKPQMLRFKKIKPANKAHPLVRRLIELMNEQQCTIAELSKAIGMSKATFTTWRSAYTPRLDLIIAAFNYLGYDLAVVEQKEKQ